MTDTLEHAGRVALNTGLLAWQRDITDPTRKAFGDPAFAEDRAFIDSCIRSDDGLGWSRCSAFVKSYRWDGDYEWCGAFAAYCWHASIPLAIRRRYFPSTYRLDRYGQHRRAFAEAVPVVPLSMRRKYLAIDGDADDIDHFGPRAGDILIVNGRGRCAPSRWSSTARPWWSGASTGAASFTARWSCRATMTTRPAGRAEATPCPALSAATPTPTCRPRARPTPRQRQETARARPCARPRDGSAGVPCEALPRRARHPARGAGWWCSRATNQVAVRTARAAP